MMTGKEGVQGNTTMKGGREVEIERDRNREIEIKIYIYIYIYIYVYINREIYREIKIEG